MKSAYCKPHKRFLTLAIKILDDCVNEMGKDGVYSEKQGGKILTIEETSKYFDNYIKQLELQDFLTYIFSDNTIAPTSVIHDPNG